MANKYRYELENLNKALEPSIGNQRVNYFLVLCCITVSLSSFQFGYNISSLNSPTNIIKEFLSNNFFLYRDHKTGNNILKQAEESIKRNESELIKAELVILEKQSDIEKCSIKLNQTCHESIKDYLVKLINHKNILSNDSVTIDDLMSILKEYLNEKKSLLGNKKNDLETLRKKVKELNDNYIWPILNSLFVVGGMIGAFTSKYVLDYLGRKKGIIFNSLFGISGSIIVFLSPYLKSPMCLMVSRLLFGIQGGMACSLLPTYLSEISPANMRGRIAGVIPQLHITTGILFGQILGFNEILGNEEYWHYLLAFPFIPALTGSVIFLFFFPESPKFLLTENKIEDARKSLRSIRQDKNIEDEIKEILNELSLNSSNDNASILDIFKAKELKWSLLTSILLQVLQQLCGINAVFFYSSSIFANAGIPKNLIQYAILATGIVNVLTTIVCVPLIDRLGRKPLLIYPMIAISIDFVLLTIFLNIRGTIYANLSIACIVIFIISFAVGLGPIPSIYCAECFRQNERSSAMAFCIFINWVSALLLTLLFPYLQLILKSYVFLVFTVIVTIGVIIAIIKVPETKGQSADKIIERLNSKKNF